MEIKTQNNIKKGVKKKLTNENNYMIIMKKHLLLK